jgi:hypothetical protein
VLLAVIIGIVLLQVVDDGSSGPVGASQDTETTTTQATGPDSTTRTTVTTQATQPARDPADVRVLVLNAGSGVTGIAGDKSAELREKGYTNQPEQANNWETQLQGMSVMCREGFDAEAQALAVAVGEGTQVQPFPDPAPPFSENADCVVAIGATS